MSHKRKKLNKLVFPDHNTWVAKWLSDAILATPKWQINSTLGSFYYNEYIDILASRLDGMKLPSRTNPETNWARSMAVGIAVAMASKEYEDNKVKVEMTTQNQFLKDLLSAPVIKLALGQSTVAPGVRTANVISPEGTKKAVAVTAS
jgi:hypothetical protein